MSDGGWVFIDNERSHVVDFNVDDDAETPVAMTRILRKPLLEIIPHSRDWMKLASSESVHPAPDHSSISRFVTDGEDFVVFGLLIANHRFHRQEGEERIPLTEDESLPKWA